MLQEIEIFSVTHFQFRKLTIFRYLTEFQKIKDANLERIAKSLLSRISNFQDFNSNGPA